MIDDKTITLDHDEKMLVGAGIKNPPEEIEEPVVTEQKVGGAL